MYYKKLLCYRSGISETQIALPSLPELILVWHHWSGGDKVTLGCILGAFEGILTPPLAWPAPFCPSCLFLLLHICSGPAQGTGMGLITAALVFSCFPFTPQCSLLSAPAPFQQQQWEGQRLLQFFFWKEIPALLELQLCLCQVWNWVRNSVISGKLLPQAFTPRGWLLASRGVNLA